ncbi:hypothetical protein [Streptomyces glaucescens]|uniref:Uncharacterized protein n=1 Tax=Streptomyces glaucescens TaxID=1907 RepID=A0A089Z523_STRGA|nr:hypothetical protein [Streptomyces glaucescens]AIS00871.1 hypothetical protein SGLAU_24645 [Streptomyces glaucescens]
MTDEQHQADLERARNQNSFADLARTVEHADSGGILTRWVIDPVRTVVGSTGQGKAVFGSTDFAAKNLDLNEMIDLVEQTDPEDLESSGNALLDARTAIADAAKTLSGDIAAVPWVGEAGEAFRQWGERLVKGSTELSEFAGKAGDQLVAASMGLASVRKAMPARDPKNLKRPENFSDAEKAAKKDDYDAAVKVEKDRQEAINQMNRLASYYAVSSQQLAALQEKPPTFGEVPAGNMPRDEGSGGTSAGAASSATRSVTAGEYQAPAESQGRSGVSDPSGTPTPTTSGRTTVTLPDDAVGTNIDSVGTLPPTTTTPVTGPTPPVTGTPPTVNGQPGGFDPYVPTVPGKSTGRTPSGTSGLRTPAPAQGRTQPGPINSATGRTTGPGTAQPMGRATGPGTGQQTGRTTGPAAGQQMGRATPTGHTPGRGAGSGSKPFPMGQAGVSGGTPRTTGTPGARANAGPATGAGRANGVVGGRPTTGGAAPKGGSRIPRGTVIGSGSTTGPRPSAGGGQRGVFGAPPANTRPATGAASAPRGGGVGAGKPVTGSPTGRNSAVQAERNGMTRGGAGLVRRSGEEHKSGDERDTQGTPRPDCVAEDPETHLPDRPRRDVPPVVN